MSQLQFIFQEWSQQGAIMWALHGVGILTAATVIDRGLFSFASRARRSSVQSLGRAETDRAAMTLEDLAEQGPDLDYLVAIARAGQDASGSAQGAAWVANERIVQMDQRVGLLDWAVVVAPMLGILGTGIGMALAFRDDTNGLPDPRTLGSGISLALKTTIWGLSISIAASTARSVLRATRQRACSRIHALLRLVEYANPSEPTQ